MKTLYSRPSKTATSTEGRQETELSNSGYFGRARAKGKREKKQGKYQFKTNIYSSKLKRAKLNSAMYKTYNTGD